MILIYDASANGSPKNWKAPATDTFNWPRLLHLAWLEYSMEGALESQNDYLIKPLGFEISEKVEKFHHVKLDELVESGHDEKEVLIKFKNSIDRAKYIFAFNQRYHEGVLGSAFHRHSLDHRLFSSESFCLMRETTYFCKLPSKTGGYKWPTLQELHTKIFGAGYSGGNNAKIDLIAVTKCFNHLWSNGHLDDLF